MALLKHVMKGPNEIVPFNHPAINYPQFVSTKFDGFRCLNLCGERLLSPALKDFPNLQIPEHIHQFLLYCHTHRIVTDGEIWSPLLTFQELQSIVRSFNKDIPDTVGYYVFDMMTESEWDNGNEKTFVKRYIDCQQMLTGFRHVIPVTQQLVNNATEATEMFQSHIDVGEEGIILRQPAAQYKHGRTTLNQDGMWKFKEFQTHDAIIVSVEEQMMLKQGVERTRDSLGHLERRYEQDLYEPAGLVGAFVIEHEGKQFKIKPGKGHDNAWKRDKWFHRDTLIGKHIEFKYMPHGTMDNPRIGSLVRFRPDKD